MNATRKVKLKDIKLNLTCKLCQGYLVDATTVIECLHSFCKSCIVNYLEKSDREEKYCPVCDVQLHSTKPLTSIRSDLMLQEIVYKLVPGLFKKEMCRRREFYASNEDAVPANPLDSGQVFDESYITSDDVMHLSMEYVTEDEKLRENTRRYLKCPAAVSIFVLKKLLQGKYDLDVNTSIDIMFGDRILPDDFLLMDVAYKYSWAKNGNKPLSLCYRIRGNVKPVIKLDKTINEEIVSVEVPKGTIQEELQIPPANKKKVCNENGSNIMPSEEVKPSQIKIPANGLISGEAAIAPIKAPNVKFKGRKRKHLNYSDIIIENKDDIKNLAKRLKLEKTTVKPSVKKSQSDSSLSTQTLVETTTASNNNNESSNGVNHAKDVNEVQLQISENGVMSARSVSFSGDDKIVYDLSKRVCNPTPSSTSNSNTSPVSSTEINLTEKLLLSGNFHSKTGPSGVTEIICDRPDPSSTTLKPATAKPGYVTLNIPTPKNPVSSQNGRTQNALISNGNAPDKKKLITPGQSNGLTPAAKVNERTNSDKSDVLDKIRNKLTAKGTDGDKNKLKSIVDLEKRCNSVGTSIESVNLGDRQRTTGMHSLPIIAQMSSPFQHQLQRVKNPSEAGKPPTSSENFTLPLALNFSPASGMSVSMIPCTNNGSNGTTNGNNSTGAMKSISSQITTPPKRAVHQTSVVNGDLKFTSAPKLILPKPTGDPEVASKKPPKFFKSRRMSSPGPSPTTALSNKHNTSSSHRNDNEQLKRKLNNGNNTNGRAETVHKKVNREQGKESGQSSTVMDAFIKLLNSGTLSTGVNQTNTLTGKQVSTNSHANIIDASKGATVSRPLTFPAQTNDKYSSQHLTALSNLAAVNSSDVLNSGLGIAAVAAAAAAANVNGVPVGMVPFVTDNYCSLPFINHQRLPMAQFPYGCNFPTPGYVGGGSNTNLTTATTTPVNSSKSKSTNSIPSPGSKILNGLLLATTSSNDSSGTYSSSTLDLSLAKSTSTDTASVPQKVVESNPLLASLLNSRSTTKSPTENKNTQVTGERNSPQRNGHAHDPNSREKSKSPLIRQLLERNEGKGNTRASSPQEPCNGINGNNQEANKEAENQHTIGIANGRKLIEYLRNGSNDKPQNSLKMPEATIHNTDNSNLKEPKVSVRTDSPQKKNDNDSNISRNSTKITLDQEKLLCLSAQNNNNHTLSNNHDKANDTAAQNKASDNVDCANVTKSNGKSDNNVSSAGTELSPCT